MRRDGQDSAGSDLRARSGAVNARRVGLALGLALAVVLASCGGDGNQPAPPTKAAPETVLSGPLPPSLVQVAKDVAQLRGLPAPDGLQMGFVPRANVPALLDRLLSDDDRAKFAQTTTLYRLLGHFRPDEDYLSIYRQLGAESAAGLYSPPDKTLWIVQQGDAPPDLNSLSREAKSTLAHELVHATQDAAFDLEALSGNGDLDATLALTCLIEGDAVAHQGLYAAKYLASTGSGAGADLLAGFVSDIPPSLNREFFFPYTTCADWVQSARESGGTAAINALFRNPPKSTALVLHPERGLNWRPSAVSLPDLAHALGSGWKRESGGTLGEFQLRNYLQLRLPGLRSSIVAAGWAGDRYDVYSQGQESVAVFRVAFDDETKAAGFRAAQDDLLSAAGAKATLTGGVSVASRADGNTTARLSGSGREVIFAIGSNADVSRRALIIVGGG